VPKLLVHRLGIFAVHGTRYRQHPGALHVLEEFETEPLAFVGSLDDARDVRHHEGARIAHADHAEIRLQVVKG
jgi:hypothetical protein